MKRLCALVLTIVALVGLTMATFGCDSPDVAEAKVQSRYQVERINGGFSAELDVVTDTETGRRWLFGFGTNGGVTLEPMDKLEDE